MIFDYFGSLQVTPRSDAPSRFLASLPLVSAEVLKGFMVAMAATHSEKEQRGLVKRLLMQVIGPHTHQPSHIQQNSFKKKLLYFFKI
jgi:hypothetical protein